jgi:hypothetical protein
MQKVRKFLDIDRVMGSSYAGPCPNSVAYRNRNCLLQISIKNAGSAADAAHRLDELLEIRAVRAVLGIGLTHCNLPGQYSRYSCRRRAFDELSPRNFHNFFPFKLLRRGFPSGNKVIANMLASVRPLEIIPSLISMREITS